MIPWDFERCVTDLDECCLLTDSTMKGRDHSFPYRTVTEPFLSLWLADRRFAVESTVRIMYDTCLGSLVIRLNCNNGRDDEETNQTMQGRHRKLASELKPSDVRRRWSGATSVGAAVTDAAWAHVRSLRT
jgi:hypothetical protein